jgi:hypothetical protein
MQKLLRYYYSHNQKKIYIIYTNQFNFLKLNNIFLIGQNSKLFICGLPAIVTSSKYNYLLLKKITFNKYRSVIKLNGLNFKFNILLNYLQCTLGYSHLIYISLPKGLSVKLIEEKKNLLIIESFNYALVQSFVKLLKGIKPINPYSLAGVCLNSEIHRNKIGKKK